MLCYHTSEMSCPYFEPIEPNPRSGAASLPLLPLGGAWSGICHATPAPQEPQDAGLERICNLGYARGVCPRFPAGDPGPDAARFSLTADEGGSLRIYYVLERDHQPFAHGPVEFVIAQGSLTGAPAGELTARQASAYAASYLRTKAAAL